jgi:hypothetical protein
MNAVNNVLVKNTNQMRHLVRLANYSRRCCIQDKRNGTSLLGMEIARIRTATAQ